MVDFIILYMWSKSKLQLKTRTNIDASCAMLHFNVPDRRIPIALKREMCYMAQLLALNYCIKTAVLRCASL
jgi:hypothetical protein